jgi:hypothetical protein
MKTLLAAFLTAMFLVAADQPAGDKAEKSDKKSKEKKGDKKDDKKASAPAGGGW